VSEIPPEMVADGQAQPDVAELLQEELTRKAVPVQVNAPVTTHELPSRTARYYTETIGEDLARILHPDPKRKKGFIMLPGDPATDTFVVSHTSGAGSGAPWPANVPLPISHWDSVWAAAPEGAESVTLTVVIEVWAD